MRFHFIVLFFAVLVAVAVGQDDARLQQPLHITPGDECDVPPETRVDCAWKGITPEECEASGCCFNNKKPKVYWCFCKLQNMLRNEAYDSCTESTATQNPCDGARDGSIAPFDEWVSNGQSDGAWVRFVFNVPVLITSVRMWQRCDNQDQFGYFVFKSDALGIWVVQHLPEACNGGSAWDDCLTDPGPDSVFDLPDTVTTDITIEGIADCAVNIGQNGIREVELIGWAHRIQCYDPICPANYWYCRSDYLCENCGCAPPPPTAPPTLAP